MDILKAPEEIAWKLDEYQLAATEAPLGNTCVLAVAGSGKTTLLTHRVANLLYHGIPEHEILLLTFTNQAAKEMTDRIHTILGKDDIGITSGTFHSVANLFLKKFERPRKQIIDEDDALAYFKKSYDSVVPEDMDEDFLKYLSYRNLYRYLSGSINHNKELMFYITNTKGMYFLDEYEETAKEVIKNYKERKLEAKVRDFDDLIVDVYHMLLNSESIRNNLADRYKYIFVDEYQDVNWLQYNFLRLLNKHNNMFVVGDRNQCIYQFRGSRDEYIDSFELDYPGVQTYFLKKNYRSRPEILKVAENSINFNGFRYPVELIPFKESDDANTVLLNESNNQYDEANEIIWDIQNKYSSDEYEDIAILVRANYQTKLFEQELINRGMPYRVVGALGFYERAHIKVITALLTFLQNHSNEIAFEKVIKLFPGVGEKTAAALYQSLRDDYSFEAFNMVDDYSFKKSDHLFAMKVMAELMDMREADSIISYFMDVFYEDYIIKQYEDSDDRIQDIDTLIIQTESYDLDEFLDNVNLYNVNDSPDENEDEAKITLMTTHKAKGKEWKYVYLPCLISESFPMKVDKADYLLNTDSTKAERNLFYVACTRAKERLVLSYYKNYKMYIKQSRQAKLCPIERSPFISEAIEKVMGDFGDNRNI